MGLRRSRYIGQEKTHLQHVATAAALNHRSLYGMGEMAFLALRLGVLLLHASMTLLRRVRQRYHFW